jgi:hypothetical protein
MEKNSFAWKAVLSGDFVTPGPESGIMIRDPGWGKNLDPDLGMNIPDNFSDSLETTFLLKILKCFNRDIRIRNFLTLDPGWKNSDPK